MTFPLTEAPVAGTTSGHANDHGDIAKLLNSSINSQAGTSYTFASTDFGRIVETTSASAVSLTVPPNSSVPFAIGTIIGVLQVGAGTVTIVAGSGVTINAPTTLVSGGQWSALELRKRATDTWVLSGRTT